MPDKDTEKRIADAIMKAIEKDIEAWHADIEMKYDEKFPGIGEFSLSRILKRSGNQHQRRLIFGYGNETADKLEVGTPAKQIKGKYTQRVKAHTRKLGAPPSAGFITKLVGKVKKKKVRVKAHKREYKNYKPTRLSSGEWRILGKIPKRKGMKAISKSAKKRLTGKAMEKLIADGIKQEF